MTAKVFAFPGTPLPPPPGVEPPAAKVIELLERMLDMARQGIIQGVAVATVERGNNLANGWASAETVNTHLLTASASYLSFDLSNRPGAKISTPTEQG